MGIVESVLETNISCGIFFSFQLRLRSVAGGQTNYNYFFTLFKWYNWYFTWSKIHIIWIL